jgi:hypothetical protein
LISFSKSGKQADKEIGPNDRINESQITDRLKAGFDDTNKAQMEDRNRQLQYLREKIEERLLFGKRDEIQHLFCELEKMNALEEKELVGLGIG